MLRCRSDRGQVAPLLAVIVLVAGGAAIVLAQLGGAALARARARTAADAAALAGVIEGREGAAAVALINGGSLESFVVDNAAVEVVVAVGEASARARAVVEGAATGAEAVIGGGDRDGLASAMAAALARADDLLGRPVPVVSGFRTAAEQAALWAARDGSPYPVAPPGSSDHERGMAVDVPSAFVDDLVAVAAEAGLCQPLPTTDPVHFEPCPPT